MFAIHRGCDCDGRTSLLSPTNLALGIRQALGGGRPAGRHHQTACRGAGGRTRCGACCVSAVGLERSTDVSPSPRVPDPACHRRLATSQIGTCQRISPARSCHRVPTCTGGRWPGARPACGRTWSGMGKAMSAPLGASAFTSSARSIMQPSSPPAPAVRPMAPGSGRGPGGSACCASAAGSRWRRQAAMCRLAGPWPYPQFKLNCSA